MVGTRKASVLPVPVFAWARLGEALADWLDLWLHQRLYLHIIAVEHLVDSLTLHLSHGFQAHPGGMGDVSDDLGINQTIRLQIGKLCDQSLLGGLCCFGRSLCRRSIKGRE